MTELELPEGLTAFETPLPGIKVDTPAAQGVIYTNGAHVAEWTPAGARPVLWLSASSVFEPGKAIRGGIPIIWPWFGAGADNDKAPAHGFARSPSGTFVTRRSARPASRRCCSGWRVGRSPSISPPICHVTSPSIAGSMGRALSVQLMVTAGAEDLRFEGAYTPTSPSATSRRPASRAWTAPPSVTGSPTRPRYSPAPSISPATDRVYESKSRPASSTRLGGTIQVEGRLSQTVVWNPWIAKAAAMADFGDDEWTGMVCVEAVNTREQSIVVPAGETHLLSQTISLL